MDHPQHPTGSYPQECTRPGDPQPVNDPCPYPSSLCRDDRRYYGDDGTLLEIQDLLTALVELEHARDPGHCLLPRR